LSFVAAFPRSTSSKEIQTVAAADSRRKLSTEITKADISLMCEQSGGEEETEVIKLFMKWNHPAEVYVLT